MVWVFTVCHKSDVPELIYIEVLNSHRDVFGLVIAGYDSDTLPAWQSAAAEVSWNQTKSSLVIVIVSCNIWSQKNNSLKS